MKKLIALFTDWKLFIVFTMGFASGLPYNLTGGTLKMWLADPSVGVDLKTVGWFSLVGLPYTLKFLWAPFLDRYVPPFLGRRRGWMAIMQVLLACGLIVMMGADPKADPWFVAAVACGIAFMSSTLDISIDAYRREVLPAAKFAIGMSLYVTGYRLAMMLSDAGALAIADLYSWRISYLVMAIAMGATVLFTFFAPEPEVELGQPTTLTEAVVGPFREFFSRSGALWIIAFILLYKVGDNMASAITGPFYYQLSYSKLQIAGIVKIFGIWGSILGTLVGGGAMIYLGLRRSLWVFGILQAVSTLGFAFLRMYVPIDGGAEFASSAAGLGALAAVIGFENFTGGMGTAGYGTFMAMMTNKRYTATQMALLTSLMGVPRVIISSPTGWMAERMGWTMFFVFCTVVAIPGLLLLLKVGKWADAGEKESAQSA